MSVKAPSANPKYRLSYFNVKALAEPIRFLFAYGGIKYEDVRVEKEQWEKLKPTMPMGQMPVLEIDGIQTHQSVAISRYVAKLVGLAGTNDWENLLIDIAVDTINDFRQRIAIVHYETDENAKKTKFVTLKSETIPFYLEKLEALAKENNGHFALNKLTWADFYFTAILDYIKYMLQYDFLEKYPTLQALVNNTLALEPIKAWVAKRPVTDL